VNSISAELKVNAHDLQPAAKPQVPDLRAVRRRVVGDYICLDGRQGAIASTMFMQFSWGGYPISR
jgi:hypothetical protein